MATEKEENTKVRERELALAESWFAKTFSEPLTQEEILKLILYRLHKLEEQSTRINSIL